jgi:hypothetical protein
MQNNFYMFLVAPLLGWLTVVSVVIIAYLATLEIKERRKNRRLEEKRAQLSLQAPYRPKAPRRLAFQTTVRPTLDSSDCLKVRQAFLKIDRPSGWDRTATNLN